MVSFHTPEVSIGQLGNWDSDTLSLYFTNYNGTDLEPSLFRFDYIEKELYGAFLNGSTPNFLLRVGQPWEHLFVIGTDNHGFLIEWDGNSPNATTLETLFTLPPDNFLTHTDFATPSPGGRLFGGGLPKTFCGAPANLTFPFYSYDHKNGFQILENGTRTSNGIVFDYFRGKMYRLDSCERIIVQYDYDFLTDSICTLFSCVRGIFTKTLKFHFYSSQRDGNLWHKHCHRQGFNFHRFGYRYWRKAVHCIIPDRGYFRDWSTVKRNISQIICDKFQKLCQRCFHQFSEHKSIKWSISQ